MSKEVVLPKQERPRQPRSRKRRNRCKAKRVAQSPSHTDEEGVGAQQKANGNESHGPERGPRRHGKFRGNFDRGGRLWQLTERVCQLASFGVGREIALHGVLEWTLIAWAMQRSSRVSAIGFLVLGFAVGHFEGVLPWDTLRINQVAFLRDGVARTKPRRAEASRQARRSFRYRLDVWADGGSCHPSARITFRIREHSDIPWATAATSFCMRWVNNKRPPCKSTGEALGSATGPSGATGRHWALPRARRGNWEALGTATGPSGSNWEELGTATGPSGATGRHWALPRARRGQLGGTGHCHGPGGNWEALGTATGQSGNWEALGTATGRRGVTE
ncbi:hypothetical protein GH714_043988 [Hevea brasiliensis]|uniref:Uncharacterized protein n=1 Tax=Hevea brasiliensis TaxID=3981 RepID=A0A6A6K0R1_HEVBR|nr:hypothetical protein GH714_043988 [Hevea brasiliensis]